MSDRASTSAASIETPAPQQHPYIMETTPSHTPADAAPAATAEPISISDRDATSTSTATTTNMTSGTITSPESTGSPPPGRKKVLSFKDKQRQAKHLLGVGSDIGGRSPASNSITPTTTTSTMTGPDFSSSNAEVGSTAASSPMLPSGLPRTGAAQPQPQQTTSCVFTALEPTRVTVGRGAGPIRPPNRHAPAPSSAGGAVDMQSSTSLDPTPSSDTRGDLSASMNASHGLVMLRSPTTSEAITALPRVSRGTPLRLDDGTSNPILPAAAAAAPQTTPAEAPLPSTAQQNTETLRPSTSSVSGSPGSAKLSFKERQRLKATATTSRSPMLKAAITSPVSQMSPTTTSPVGSNSGSGVSGGPKNFPVSTAATTQGRTIFTSTEKTSKGSNAQRAATATATARLQVTPLPPFKAASPPPFSPTGTCPQSCSTNTTGSLSPPRAIPRLPIDRIKSNSSTPVAFAAASGAAPQPPSLQLQLPGSAAAAAAAPHRRAPPSDSSSTTSGRSPKVQSPVVTIKGIRSPPNRCTRSAPATTVSSPGKTAAERKGTVNQADVEADDEEHLQRHVDASNYRYVHHGSRLHTAEPETEAPPHPSSSQSKSPSLRTSHSPPPAHTSTCRDDESERRSDTMIEKSVSAGRWAHPPSQGSSTSHHHSNSSTNATVATMHDSRQASTLSDTPSQRQLGGKREAPLLLTDTTAAKQRADESRHGTGRRRTRADTTEATRTAAAAAPGRSIHSPPPLALTGSRSPRRKSGVSESVKGRQFGAAPAATASVVGHWKRGSLGQSSSTANLSGTQDATFTLAHMRVDSALSLGDTYGGPTSQSKRRHRDKMLAPDGTLLPTPRTAYPIGGEGSGSFPNHNNNASTSYGSPRLHNRSHTVDDFALYAMRSGHRENNGAYSPTSTQTFASTHVTPSVTVVPNLPTHGTTASREEAEEDSNCGGMRRNLQLRGSPEKMAVSVSTVATPSSPGAHVSPRSHTVVSFPSLPSAHAQEQVSRDVIAMSRVSHAMAAVLPASDSSQENLSNATPTVAIATPNEYRSGDEGSLAVSRGVRTDVYDSTAAPANNSSPPPAREESDTTGAETEGMAHEGDYLLQTYGSTYAAMNGEMALNATTAEMRRARRRSTYSSLHYGTMTNYHRRSGPSRRSSDSVSKQGSPRIRHGRYGTTPRRRRSLQPRNSAAQTEADSEGAQSLLERRMAATAKSGKSTHERAEVTTDSSGDNESVMEQKGSEREGEGDSAEQQWEEGGGEEHVAGSRGRRAGARQGGDVRKKSRGSKDRAKAALHMAAMDADEEAEGTLRRTIGLWETVEHILIPRYELVPEAAALEPLTGPASPNSPSGSNVGSGDQPSQKFGDRSPVMAPDRSDPTSPKVLSPPGLQKQSSTGALVSPPLAPSSPYASAIAANLPQTMPTPSSVENSPSTSATNLPTAVRGSGLVVLPDAANCSEDPNSSASLTYSQFRRISNPPGGTTRLQPEKFSFGTVAANYNMEPVDEQKQLGGAADAKAAARLVFEAAAGVMLMDPDDEGGRYEAQGRGSPDAQSRSSSPHSRERQRSELKRDSTSSQDKLNEESEAGEEEEEEGACRCSANFIAKDFKGLDCSRYDASDLYDHCCRCQRRPAAFMCLHCLQAVCPSHVRRHHLLHPTECTLFLNLLDIMSSFDRVFWCEKCQQFTWKFTEVYDTLVDQIAYTRGTYLKHPARDIHCVGYEIRLKDTTNTNNSTNSAVPAMALPSSTTRSGEISGPLTGTLGVPCSAYDVSDGNTSNLIGSPARLQRVVSGSSLNAAMQPSASAQTSARPYSFASKAPAPLMTTAGSGSGSSPIMAGPYVRMSVSPKMRVATPPVNTSSVAAPPVLQLGLPALLGVNNLIVFGASPRSPRGGVVTSPTPSATSMSAAATAAVLATARLSCNAVGTPAIRALQSPMRHLLTRDSIDTTTTTAVTVGEPVGKLCVLGASVQGWRTTQEDAEAVFFVDIPAISKALVHRKELRAVAAEARKEKRRKEELAAAQQQQQQEVAQNAQVRHADAHGGDVGELLHDDPLHAQSPSARDSSVVREDSLEGASSSSANPPHFDYTMRAGDRPTWADTSPARDAHSSPSPPSRPSRAEDSEKRKKKEEDEETEAEAGDERQETIPMAVFCVFDGHGGDAVAKLAARHFETHLRNAIAGTRPDDVRARALLFYLNAESNLASVPGVQPALTAIAGADGSYTFVPQNTSSAMPRVSISGVGGGVVGGSIASYMAGACSPPGYFSPGAHGLASPCSPHLDRGSGSSPKLLVPTKSLPRTGSIEDGFGPREDGLPPPLSNVNPVGGTEDEENGMPQILDLPELAYTESIPVVLPVTTESLRLHMASSMAANPTRTLSHISGENSRAASPSHQALDGCSRHSHGMPRDRRSKTKLDAWDDVAETPPTEVSSSAAVAGSPMAAMLMSASLAGAGDFSRYGNASYSNVAMAGSTSFAGSPTALVSIPEMEMLRQYFASIMEEALLALDKALRETPEGVRGDYDCVGCTACVVGVTANFVLCANVGDSGAAFYTKDRIKVISVKHRVTDEAEQARIHAAGYSIVNDRIEGMSAVPRALGDFDFKQCGGRGPSEQAVSAVPDVTIMPVPSDTDQWGIILACDGVWDTATLHQVHVALTNTVNDLEVASSATEAVLRGAELHEHHRRGPAATLRDSPSVAGGKAEEGDEEGSLIGDYENGAGGRRRLPQMDPTLLTAAAGVFAQCVAPADNDEGVGLDNCSLILVERRNIQE